MLRSAAEGARSDAMPVADGADGAADVDGSGGSGPFHIEMVMRQKVVVNLEKNLA